MKKFSYSNSGVSIDKGNQFVSQIKKLLKKNKKQGSADIGGFAGKYKINQKYKNPTLIAATDGVGTKLSIANMLNKHDTIGIDLVAMCVNDIIVTGAKPLFFLDYIATGKLEVGKAVKIVKGIVKGCELANCSLLGGETAEMPEFYSEKKYDLAGFCVGIADDSKKVQRPKANDLIVGIESSGIHSNGYSLIRKILKTNKIRINMVIPKTNKTVGKHLIEPTKIYVDPILELYRRNIIKTCAHITGGGIIENLPRVLPKNIQSNIDLNKWKLPKLYKWIKSQGVTQKEMLRTFNCGYGMIVIIDKKNHTRLKQTLKKYKLSSDILGTLKNKGVGENILFNNAWN